LTQIAVDEQYAWFAASPAAFASDGATVDLPSPRRELRMASVCTGGVLAHPGRDAQMEERFHRHGLHPRQHVLLALVDRWNARQHRQSSRAAKSQLERRRSRRSST
jgi:hypothetical protein